MPILSEEDLERFRTKVCTLASSMKCDFGVERCNYSHNIYWARRCPFYLRDSSILRYIPHCCPDVELGEGTTVLRNSCPRGNNCSFAHSFEEIHYHPLVYKTEVCKDYRLGKCKTYYCHLVHGLAEYRVPREYVLPKKVGLEIPALAHVKMVDNIRSISTGNVSVGCFQKGKASANAHAERRPDKAQREGAAWPHEGGDSCSLKSWSSIKWRARGADKEQLSNNLSTSISSNNSREPRAGRDEETLRPNSSIESADRSEDSIYDWYKLISMPKIDYTDNEVGLSDDKNYSILKLYDKHLSGGYDFSQLSIYGSEPNGYGGQFEPEMGGYAFESENRSDSLVRRNVNMWNEASTKKIIESTDNALGTVSSIMEDSYQSYEEAFKASDLDSSVNSNADDICSSIYHQCELIKRNSRESGRDKVDWGRVVEQCRKLLDMAMEASEMAKGKSEQE